VTQLQKVKFGKHRERRSYARISEVIDLPDLIEIQTLSYEKFLETGLKDVFRDVSPIEGNNDKLSLEFIDYKLGTPKYNVDESKERDATYSAPLRVRVRLINKERDEIKEQEVFMGELPLMTETGTFIINGAERVIVSQLVRSPSVYFTEDDKLKVKNIPNAYKTTVIPNRGAWLEFEKDIKGLVYARIDRTRKIPLTTLIRALGFESDESIVKLFGEDTELLNTLEPSSSKRESSVKASSERAIDRIISARRGSEMKLFSLTTGISSAQPKRCLSSSHTAKRIAKSLSTELGENLSSR